MQTNIVHRFLTNLPADFSAGRDGSILADVETKSQASRDGDTVNKL
jgi:hypothetical protein